LGSDHDVGLVFLHEGLGSIPQWRDFPEALAVATGLDAIVYDRRNHGGSDPLPAPRGREYHAEEARILDGLLDGLGIDRAVTYGHSDGATIALLHAAAHPGRVAAVISEAGHAVAEETARDGIRHARRRFRSGRLRDALFVHHGEHVDAMFDAWAGTWLDPMFDDWSIVGDLRRVAAPVLVLQGEHDEYATPAHVGWIADAVSGPTETWIVPGAGHAPHREATGDVVARVAAFLRHHARY
jgi:pimeloyl-ACP methyl ester carboxylesterase